MTVMHDVNEALTGPVSDPEGPGGPAGPSGSVSV